jgi:hypothetical protein
MSPKAKAAPNPAVVLYDKLIATNPKIERKGDANPYTSLDGNMFTLLHQSRLAIRLPGDQREKFFEEVPDDFVQSLRHGNEGVRSCS